MLINDNQYLSIIETIKSEIAKSQYKAALQINRELTLIYQSIGTAINECKIWGNKFIDNLAKDIKLAFPNSTGYSVRNLKYMAKFAAEYPDIEFVQQVVAQIPWGHNIVLLDGMPEIVLKTAVPGMYSFIKSKRNFTSGKFLRKKFQILKAAYLPLKVNSPSRL